MTLFEIDPNVVKPGWTPLLIIIGLACVMVLLYLSMRRQFKKIHAAAGPDGEAAVPTQSAAAAPDPADDTDQAIDISRPRSGRT